MPALLSCLSQRWADVQFAARYRHDHGSVDMADRVRDVAKRVHETGMGGLELVLVLERVT